MPKQRTETRKISVDLPMYLWNRYEELGAEYGMKIKEFILGAFEAADFLDKFLSETLTEEQLQDISPLLRNQLEKYEALYCGKFRSRHLQKKKVYFDKENDLREDPELLIRTHDIVKNFEEEDRFSLELMNVRDEKRQNLVDELVLR